MSGLTEQGTPYEMLRRRLLTGGFESGQRLSPSVLADQFGTSISPIREALQRLASEGFIERFPRRGMFVPKQSRKDVADLLELRDVLERHAAGVAARRITDNELIELEGHFSKMEAGGQAMVAASGDDFVAAYETYHEADMAFHLLLLRAAGNDKVLNTLENTHALLMTFGFRTDPPQAWEDRAGFVDKNLAVHRAVYEAVQARRPRQARRAMMEHHKRAKHNLLGRLDAIEKGGGYAPDVPGGELSSHFRKRIGQAVHDALEEPREEE